YSMHTNFDDGKGGMNDALVAKLALNDCYIAKSCPSMRIGYLANEMNIEEFAIYAKKKLNVNYGLLIKGNDKPIRKVGIVGGGGSYFYPSAIEEECDIYISGDISHHTRRDIVIRQFNYLDLPHEIEKIFMPTMEKLLKSFDSALEIKIIDHEKEPLVI
nr:Nif3-like dinuclear metal center hexameric protein [Bacilli bacterium]